MAPGSEPLSSEQRKRLNLLVTNISNEYKVDPWTLWKEVVHTRIGVSKVGDIPKDKFAEAERALQEHAEHLHSLAHAKRLVAEVLQIANEQGLYQDLTRFCSREFGVTVLNKLNPEQLKQALKFVEDGVASPVQSVSQPPDGSASDPTPPAATRRSAFVAEAKTFVSQYPVHCGAIALVLMFLGKIV